LPTKSGAASGTAAEAGRHLLLADDAPGLAAAVVRLLRDPRLGAKLAREARRLVETSYRWESSIEGLERIYDGCLARRQP
jgi:polysaccharide biosynthesis protein PslH